MDGGAWWAAVHGVAKSQTRLSDFTFAFHFPALEKAMATHSSVLAWRIPGMGEPGGLPSLGSHRVGHDWSDLAAAAAVKLSGVWSTEIQVLLLFLKCKKKKKRMWLRGHEWYTTSYHLSSPHVMGKCLQILSVKREADSCITEGSSNCR